MKELLFALAGAAVALWVILKYHPSFPRSLFTMGQEDYLLWRECRAGCDSKYGVD